MTTRETLESLEVWLSNKPFWEQYVWHLNLQKESLSKEDIEQCYQYLSGHLGLIDPISEGKPRISFIDTTVSIQKFSPGTDRLKLIEVKDITDVNALSSECSFKVGDNLTLIYGSNGSGKSGIGRLLCNACFSRGKREILPNIRTTFLPTAEAKATFVLRDESGATTEVKYSLGDQIPELKRFSVFDRESVLIHLDKSNKVNFTPSQIKIFDKVADTISKLEEKLAQERNAKRKDNPFQSMFIDDATSSVATFCKSMTGNTKEEDLLLHASFDQNTDGAMIVDLQNKIDEKKKLDIPKKKTQLVADRQNLLALKSVLLGTINHFSETKMQEANELVKNILEKKMIVESLSVSSFDDGILKTVGSPEWKALIKSAKVLYESEKVSNGNKDPEHCILCHQELTTSTKTLFQKYWQFLESKAESELTQLNHFHKALLHELQSAKTLYPKFLDTDAGIKILTDENPDYLDQIKAQFKSLEDTLVDWEAKISKLEKVILDNVPAIDLSMIDNIVSSKNTEETNLIDPSAEIAKLSAQLNSLKHKKDVAAVKDAALEYLAFLKWSTKAGVVNFSGIKMANTKKRTESFLAGVAQNYKGVFNQELATLECEFNLVMNTSGDQGNTIKSYRLDFAENYSPSQILSEGERNVCSLADFLTEIQIDENNCGIIFDDPVTSLDHERKEKIAKRLADEAIRRQVVIFTHDIVFMGQLVKHSGRKSVPVSAHWMKKVDGVPGYIEENTSPRLATVGSLKNDSNAAVINISSLGLKEQERVLGAAFDYLRSACEALIEEVLFAGTIKRYEDHIRVMNLEEVVFDKASALKIVDLHGRISEVILAHNRSDQQRENPPSLKDWNELHKEFEEIEAGLKALRKDAIKDRDTRKKAKVSAVTGW